MKCSHFIPLLLETLLLDADHQRQSQELTVKAAIQCDAAECFLQLAAFPAGKELLAQHAGVIKALHALVDAQGEQALGRQATLFASGALLQIEGRTKVGEGSETESQSGGRVGGHIMLSCKHKLHKCHPVSMGISA